MNIRKGKFVQRGKTVSSVLSLPLPIQLLLLTQLLFNVGFYLVVPFIATYLTDSLAASAAMVGFILGLRTFTQQGLFFLGGALADRFGVKPILLIGIIIRVAGFIVTGIASSISLFILGVILIGFAASLFSPAAEAAIAHSGREVSEQGIMTRSELFALDTVVGRMGALSGPVLGAIVIPFGFDKACYVAAAIFLLLFLGHLLIFPEVETEKKDNVLGSIKTVLSNKVFLLFALAYSTGLVAYNQQYMAMPEELNRLGYGSESVVAIFFIFASVFVFLFQYPVTRLSQKLTKVQSLGIGFGLQAAAFLIVIFFQWSTIPFISVVLMLVLLHAGQMIAIPIARDMVGLIAGENNLGTYFGVLNSFGGIAVLISSVIVGQLFDTSLLIAPWLFLGIILGLSAFSLARFASYIRMEK